MIIAIHHRSGSFSDRWIQYCREHQIPYITVNCFESDILHTLREEGATHLMWHVTHENYQEIAVCNYVMNAAEKMGIETFPNFHTRWHFDDKVAQKYLFESLQIPVSKSYVFYDKNAGKEFLKKVHLPVVCKLKRGAGSTNVKLITSVKEGNKYIDLLFGKGILSTGQPFSHLNKKYKIARQIHNPYELVLKVISYYKKNQTERSLSLPEKGYVYFREFLPGNEFDTRIIVIGDMAFGIRRFNNKDDFRASGSGKIDYSAEKIDLEMVKIAFECTEQLKLQTAAYDFVYDQQRKPKIIEVCFGFSMKAYDACEGYWRRDLSFVKGAFNPQYFMMETFLECERIYV